MTCEATGDCRLQDLAYEYEVKGDEYIGGVQHSYPIDDPNPFIQVDRNKCILCRRCVRACRRINGAEAIGIVYRGFKARIAFGMDSTMQDSPCEFCGSCVQVCPTGGALAQEEPRQGAPLPNPQGADHMPLLRCRLPARASRQRGSDGPRQRRRRRCRPNQGFTCVKGRFGYDFIYSGPSHDPAHPGG